MYSGHYHRSYIRTRRDIGTDLFERKYVCVQHMKLSECPNLRCGCVAVWHKRRSIRPAVLLDAREACEYTVCSFLHVVRVCLLCRNRRRNFKKTKINSRAPTSAIASSGGSLAIRTAVGAS